MTYSPTDVSTWSLSAASGRCVALDIGFSVDYSVMVSAGVWPQAGYAIGVVAVKRFALGTPPDTVADAVVEEARRINGKVIFDSSNNIGVGSLLAARLPAPTATYLEAAVINNQHGHSIQPQPLALTGSGVRTACQKWSVSKAQLVEDISVELANGSLKVAKAGDWEVLRDELGQMERTVRASGSAAYSAPSGRHDDAVMALSLAVFHLRRGGKMVTAARRSPRPARYSSSAWT
jgi:hypothetical protein